MKILFEDNPHLPVSKFLKSVVETDDMYFTAGCDALCTTARVLANNGDSVYCYVDMVWDNPETEDVYCDLLALEVDYDNLHICRVPCIEFYLVLFIQLSGIYDYGLNFKKMMSMSVGSSELTYTANSFERFCKGVLNSSKKVCIQNKIDIVTGRYYLGDCPCGYDYCKQGIALEDKVRSFYTLLPGVREIDTLVEALGLDKSLLKDGDTRKLYNRMWHALYDGG